MVCITPNACPTESAWYATAVQTQILTDRSDSRSCIINTEQALPGPPDQQPDIEEDDSRDKAKGRSDRNNSTLVLVIDDCTRNHISCEKRHGQNVRNKASRESELRIQETYELDTIDEVARQS